MEYFFIAILALLLSKGTEYALHHCKLAPVKMQDLQGRPPPEWKLNGALKSFPVLTCLNMCCVQVNQWCESGIYLLASQAVDKCQSQEGAESALTDIECFLDSAQKNQLTELRNLHNQYEVVLSDDIKVRSKKTCMKLLHFVIKMIKRRTDTEFCTCRPVS